ncbi:MAG: hypothetical protein CM1200mP41_19480 [Gammaproteobacteria bacterium]|nr:MAG: hypothetical protein CM1200mP41_19480 [Gammaproteobacteria bacterium]
MCRWSLRLTYSECVEEMVEATDLLVAYRTNPHVDVYERGQEAAPVC